MDIKTINNIALNRANESAKPSQKTGGESSLKDNHVANTDKVTLTQTTTQMNNLEQTARTLSTNNSERIAEIKRAVQEGTYQVNAERVADKLMQTETLFARL